MANLSRDKKQLEIDIDTRKGINQLGYLQEELLKLNTALKKTKSAMTARELENSIGLVNEKIGQTRKEMGLMAMTERELVKLQNELRRSEKTFTFGSDQNTKKREELAAVSARLAEVRAGTSSAAAVEQQYNAVIADSIRKNGLKGLSLEQLKRHHQNLSNQIQSSASFESNINKKRIQEAQQVQNLINSRQASISGGTFTDLASQFGGNAGALMATAGRFGPYAAVIAGEYQATKAVSSTTEEFRKALIPIQNIAKSTKEYNDILSFLDRLADRTGTNILVLAGSFKSLYAAGEAAGMSLSEIQDIYGALVRSGATLKLSNEQVEGALRAVEQMISKGTISSEELKGQLGERLPGAMSIFAKSLGVSTEELQKMLKAGEVMSKDALPKFAKELDKVYGKDAQKNVKEMTGAWTRANNEFKSLLNLLGETTGINRFFAAIGNGMANFLRDMKMVVSSPEFSLWKGVLGLLPGGAYVPGGLSDILKKEKAKENSANLFDKAKSTFSGQSVSNREKIMESYERKLYEQELKLKKTTNEAQKKVLTESITAIKSNLQDLMHINYELKNNKRTGATGKPDDKSSSTGKSPAEIAAELAADRLAAEIKTSEEIYRMNIEIMSNESAAKKASLEADLKYEYDQRAEQVAAKKLNQKDLDEWYKVAEQKLAADISKIDADEAERAAKERRDAEERAAQMMLQTSLEVAQDTEDKKAILLAQFALRRHQFEIDIEKASAIEKQAIFEKYLADINRLQLGFNRDQASADAANAKTKAENDKYWYEWALDEEEKGKRQKLDNDKVIQEAKINFYQDAENAIFSIISGRLEREDNKLKTSHDSRIARLEQQKNDGILSNDEYTRQKERAEKKYELEAAKIRRRQAIADKAAALASIAINTAIAVSKVTAQTGIAAPAAVPFIIGSGLAQAAIVAAKPLPELPSYFYGGDTGPMPGTMDEKGGFPVIAHPNEYFVPRKVTQTPTFAAIKPMLESMRLGNTSRSATDSNPGATATNGNTEVFSNMANAINKLNSKLDNLSVHYGGPDWKKFHEDYNDYLTQNENAFINND